MKKFLLIMVAVLALSCNVYASETFEAAAENSLYLDKGDTVTKSVETSTDEAFGNFDIAIDPDTIIPLYLADVKDFANTSIISPSPYTIDNMPVYTALANYISDGSFAGEVRFSVSDSVLILHEYTPCKSPEFTLDFNTNKSELMDSMEDSIELEGNAAVKVGDVKLMWFEGIGYALLTSTGDDQYITTIGMQQKDSPLESAQKMRAGAFASETIETLDSVELLPIAKEYVNEMSTMSKPESGENPITGGIGESGANTANTSFILVGLLLGSLVAVVALVRKKVVTNKVQ